MACCSHGGFLLNLQPSASDFLPTVVPFRQFCSPIAICNYLINLSLSTSRPHAHRALGHGACAQLSMSGTRHGVSDVNPSQWHKTFTVGWGFRFSWWLVQIPTEGSASRMAPGPAQPGSEARVSPRERPQPRARNHGYLCSSYWYRSSRAAQR